MIVKNEEAVLGRCLSSFVGVFDEIIIVDTGSTDKTKQIAAEYTQKIYDFEWVDNFAKARNFAFSKATMDYIMWLDADDVIMKDDREKLIELKKQMTKEYDMITMRYNIGFDASGSPAFYSTRERIFKREKNYQWNDPVHEYITIQGHVMTVTDIAITHKSEKTGTSDRNIKIYEAMVEEGRPMSPRSKYYYARELKDHGRWIDAVKWFGEFLEDGMGWVEDNIASCYNLATCYKMLGRTEDELKILKQSFDYDAPRAEITCMIAYHYKNKKNYNLAASWFDVALNLPNNRSLGFVLKDYHDFIPAIELAVCYDKMGDYKRANEYNEIAGLVKPDSKEYLSNKLYFMSKLENSIESM